MLDHCVHWGVEWALWRWLTGIIFHIEAKCCDLTLYISDFNHPPERAFNNSEYEIRSRDNKSHSRGTLHNLLHDTFLYFDKCYILFFIVTWDLSLYLCNTPALPDWYSLRSAIMHLVDFAPVCIQSSSEWIYSRKAFVQTWQWDVPEVDIHAQCYPGRHKKLYVINSWGYYLKISSRSTKEQRNRIACCPLRRNALLPVPLASESKN